MKKPVIALGVVLLLAAAACGGGEQAKDAVITVTLTLPDAGPGGGEDRGGELLEAVGSAVASLQGAYAIGVMDVSAPDRLVAARMGSPLVIGIINILYCAYI